ncbi:MAG: molybdopterin-guanine dinucleotide biosynthesis protein B [Pseudomonadota bacterium]
MKLYGVTGWKNAGKTTLVARLVSEFAARGLTVSTVKHASHGFDLDQPGTDSHQHRTAGAREVLIASGRRWALMHELQDDEPSLDDLLPRLSPADLVLVEGYKTAPHPKIEAHRTATGHPLIAPGNPTIRAIAADTAIDAGGLTRLDLNNTPAIADFIAAELGL